MSRKTELKPTLVAAFWLGAAIFVVLSTVEYFSDLGDGALSTVGAVLGIIGAIGLKLVQGAPPPGPEQTLRLTTAFLRTLGALSRGEALDSSSPLPPGVIAATVLRINVAHVILAASAVALAVVLLDAVTTGALPSMLFGSATAFITGGGTIALTLLDPEPPPQPDAEHEIPLSAAMDALHAASRLQRPDPETTG